MTEPADGGLATRLTALRESAGLTKAELSRRAQVSPAYVSELEGGQGRRPSGEVLFRIAEALDVTVAELLGRKLAPPEPGGVAASLEAFAKERKLSRADVRMLASIRFRGDPPSSSRRWAMIYDAIVASRAFDDDA